MLHEKSMLNLYKSSLNYNLWTGFGCRWSGGGIIENCVFEGNEQGAWGIRKSTIKNIHRSNNVVKNIGELGRMHYL